MVKVHWPPGPIDRFACKLSWYIVYFYHCSADSSEDEDAIQESCMLSIMDEKGMVISFSHFDKAKGTILTLLNQTKI